MKATARLLWAFITIGGFANATYAQVVFPGPGSYTQNFDTLPTSGASNTWTNNVTIQGAFAFQTSGSSAITVINASDGSSNAGNLYSFGTGTSTERSWGSIPSGSTGITAYGFVVQNTSASNTAFSISYTGEQWRDAGSSNPSSQTLKFSYALSAAMPTTYGSWNPGVELPSGYTALPALDFTSPTFVETGSGAAINGNAAANQTTFMTTNLPVAVPAGQFLIIRWFDLNNMGNDHGLSIDNLTITANPAPEPATVLTIAAAAGGIGAYIRRLRKKSAAE